MAGGAQGAAVMADITRGIGAAAAMLCIAGTGFSAQGGVEEAWAAYSVGDYATAIREFRPIAEQGDANAQYNVAIMYHFGQGVPQDYAAALKWYRLAAEQGLASAQHNLGYMYDLGQGGPPDPAEALMWFGRAAEQGFSAAQYALGLRHSGGGGDYAEALKWFRLAAAQGHAGAMERLGLMYEEGQGVPADTVEAHKWLNLSAAQRRAGEDRDRVVRARDALAEKMTPEQVAEAQKLAREWAAGHP